jgi:hypothetical protein
MVGVLSRPIRSQSFTGHFLAAGYARIYTFVNHYQICQRHGSAFLHGIQIWTPLVESHGAGAP